MDLGLLAAIVGSVAGVVTVVVAVLAWRRPRTPSGGEKSKKNVVVEVAYAMPLYDTPDGTQELGEDMVSITARNATDQPVKVNGWGVHLPGNRNMLVPQSDDVLGASPSSLGEARRRCDLVLTGRPDAGSISFSGMSGSRT